MQRALRASTGSLPSCTRNHSRDTRRLALQEELQGSLKRKYLMHYLDEARFGAYLQMKATFAAPCSGAILRHMRVWSRATIVGRGQADTTVSWQASYRTTGGARGFLRPLNQKHARQKTRRTSLPKLPACRLRATHIVLVL